MKLLVMKCIFDPASYVDDGSCPPSFEDEVVCMVKIETHAEFVIYESYVDRYRYEDAFNAMLMSCGRIEGPTVIKDEDVAFYFTPLTKEPAVGETFKLDGVKYERIA